MRVLDLFSGIGGFSLGLERAGMETVAFCEIDPYCRRVLAKHWPYVPIYDDVRTLDATGLGRIDVVCGGYPCQPFSQAGKRLGEQDDRHLWPAMREVIKTVRPAWVIGENVAGHVSMGLDQVLSDLESEGYTTRPFVIPACAVDAPHRRDRVWIVASRNDPNPHFLRPHRENINEQREGKPSDGQERVAGSVCEVLAKRGNPKKRATPNVGNTIRLGGRPDKPWRSEKRGASVRRASEAVANTEGNTIGTGLCSNKPRGQRRTRSGDLGGSLPDNGRGRSEGAGPEECGSATQVGWLPEPRVGRVAHGIPKRVDRLKALGNAVVPQVVELIGRAIMKAQQGER
jgi:DNA (cytosine-5)-methyltransferase 1